MATEYYRYLSDSAEVDRVVDERRIESTGEENPSTWFSPTRYDDPVDARRELAIPNRPDHRIGPVPDVIMPTLEKGPRTVQPNFGQPGGGVEVCTTKPIWLFGLWDYGTDNWRL